MDKDITVEWVDALVVVVPSGTIPTATWSDGHYVIEWVDVDPDTGT